MGRYLERAAHASRMLQQQVSALIDRPAEEIYAGWRLIYGSLKSRPPGGMLEEESDDYTLADAFTLAGDLTFEPGNPNSIRCCLENGRENARQMRHCISNRMWLHLNFEFLDFRSTEIVEIWKSEPEKFYTDIEKHMTAFFGLADTSMYRDARWRFIQLGRAVERTQLSAALLSCCNTAPDQDAELWRRRMRAVLRIFSASDSHDRIHGHAIDQGVVLDMLATDAQLPGSLCNHIAAIDVHLTSLSGDGPEDCRRARTSSSQLGDLISHQWGRSRDRQAVLSEVEAEARQLHDMIDGCFFNYRTG